jgi:hypothetical protein
VAAHHLIEQRTAERDDLRRRIMSALDGARPAAAYRRVYLTANPRYSGKAFPPYGCPLEVLADKPSRTEIHRCPIWSNCGKTPARLECPLNAGIRPTITFSIRLKVAAMQRGAASAEATAMPLALPPYLSDDVGGPVIQGEAE